MSADLVDACQAEEHCKTNHAALIAVERRSPVQQARADETSASKAEEAADAERPVFELRLSSKYSCVVVCAGSSRDEPLSSSAVSHAVSPHRQCSSSNPEASKADVTLTTVAENAAWTRGDGERTRWLMGAARRSVGIRTLSSQTS